MNKLIKITIGLTMMAFMAVGCNDLLDVDSDQIVLPKDHQLNSPNDTVYSMIGIYHKLSKLADGYVFLGELRGDLMDITDNVNVDLEEIYNFNISEENKYNNASDYYSVINHCNYLIQNIDTSIVDKAEKVMYREYAAAKAIRAWTYMQLAINYKTVMYYEEPILTIEDANKTYPEYDRNTLVPILINELLPLQNVQLPGSISISDITTEKLNFNVRYLLGELYLWINDYANAAQVLFNLIDEQYDDVRLNPYNYMRWTVENNEFTTGRTVNWIFNVFDPSSSSLITGISSVTNLGDGNSLDSLTWFYPEVQPSEVAIENWENQTYYHNASITKSGDLRGDRGAYYSLENFSLTSLDDPEKIPGENGLIYKYKRLSGNQTKTAIVCRDAYIYLKYAEAVNRLGKPNLAFAVLKNGLNSNTITSDAIVPTWEKYSSYSEEEGGTLYPYLNFTDDKFTLEFAINDKGERSVSNGMIGLHSRGSGNVDLATDYIIPELPALEDSMAWVEDKIVEEMALETAFEGNRFQDLMRISNHRGDNTYLAEKVSAKYEDKEGMKSFLSDENNWYLSK